VRKAAPIIATVVAAIAVPLAHAKEHVGRTAPAADAATPTAFSLGPVENTYRTVSSTYHPLIQRRGPNATVSSTYHPHVGYRTA